MFNETDTPYTITTDDAAELAVDTPDLEPAPRLTQRWQCPECDNRVTLHVRVQHAPICNNKARHSRRHIDMKQQQKGSQQ
ncbi:MAG: hypothetical protein RL072_118 [Actinomycetota bacterium]|jgi:endogenous inhibitor of DNA gyrase (YacG/DUF329 family)